MSQQEDQEFFIVHAKGKQPKLKPKQQEPIPKQQQNQIKINPISLQKIDEIKGRSQLQQSKVFEIASSIRFSSDQILNQDEGSKPLIQSISCPICLLILKIPFYECQQCSNNFCINCLDDWWKKHPKQCVFKCLQPEFKLIKRSNTYNAMTQTLKIECQYCNKPFSISKIPSHIQKQCAQFLQPCKYCQSSIKRCDKKLHQQSCDMSWKQCLHCSQLFYLKDHKVHEQNCPDKLVACIYPKCLNKQIKLCQKQKHIQKCQYAPVKCQWCQESTIKLNLQEHLDRCQDRKISCKWCQQNFLIKQIIEHQIQCPLKKQTCRICQKQILNRQFKQHKQQCTYQNMVYLRELSDRLLTDNIRLRQKVAKFQEIVQELIDNSKSNTTKALHQMKMQDKKQIEKDLLRIDNSIKSVEKLKKQQFDQHMKMPHWIQSWCPLCKVMEKKFKDMLNPLLISRRQAIHKLQQIQKFNFTPK